jgi:sugar phosphate isomerase/epimerase
MKLGISSYTFPWAIGVKGHEPESPWTERELLDFAGARQIGVLQIGDNLPLESFDAARLEKLREAVERENIRLEVGARLLTAERVSAYASIAKILKARLIRFVIDDKDFHPEADEVIAVLREVGPLLGELKLGIENHDRFKASELRKIIETVGNNNIGVCLDTANSLGAGEGIETVASVLAPLTLNLHVKDFWIERVPHLMGFTVSGRPAGGGMLNVEALLNMLSPFDRCETATLELWPPAEANVQLTVEKEARWAEQSLKYLKPFFT